MQLPEITELNGIRVLTTQQVSSMYGVSRQTISYNFNYNKSKFKEGKHYIELSGQALRDFKGCHENLDNLKYAHVAYLWTEKGALLHAKSVNTEKAWEAYEYLVDFYFRTKEQLSAPENKDPVIPNHFDFQVESQEIRKYLCAIDVLLSEGNAKHSKGLHDGIMGSLDVLYLSLGKKLLDLRESDLN